MFSVAPRVLQFAIDDLYTGVTRAKLGRYAGLLLLIAGVGGYFRYQMRRIIISASRGFEYDLRNDFFAHLERLPLSFFQANRTGDLMSRATNDLSAVRMMIGPAVMYLANTLITAVVSLTLMFSVDVRLTLIALIPLPIVSITVKMFGTRDPQDVRAGAGEAVGHERGRAGIADRRSRGPRVRPGGSGDRAVPPGRTSTTSSTTAGSAGCRARSFRRCRCCWDSARCWRCGSAAATS